jgi:transcriptional regulator with XRE-family HTH domain
MKEIRARALHDRWMRTDPAYRREYQALEPEFALIEAMIQARGHAHFTQAQLARRMGTTQAVIARLESGRTKPSTRTLERFAEATGMRLRISFEPMGAGYQANSSGKADYLKPPMHTDEHRWFEFGR